MHNVSTLNKNLWAFLGYISNSHVVASSTRAITHSLQAWIAYVTVAISLKVQLYDR